jgi:hypothetical protein
MAFPTSPRAWLDAVSWHLRGVFATEANRRIQFRARELWQPAEVEARRGMARDLATELLPELAVDKQRGFLMLPARALPALDEVCEIGGSIVRGATTAAGVAPGQKPFFRFRLAKHEERLALLRVGLDRRVLAMAAAHLGVFPVIAEADFYCSFPVEGPFTKSQLWHCDDDASDVFKLFVYCDDVEADDGPFELIEADVSHRARHALGYRYGGRRYRVSDDEMARQVPAEQVTTLLGARGTAFVVDTVRCFHRGSRIRKPDRRRVVTTITYCPPSGITLPRRLAAQSAPLAEFAASFSGRLERAALGLPLARRWI